MSSIMSDNKNNDRLQTILSSDMAKLPGKPQLATFARRVSSDDSVHETTTADAICGGSTCSYIDKFDLIPDTSSDEQRQNDKIISADGYVFVDQREIKQMEENFCNDSCGEYDDEVEDRMPLIEPIPIPYLKCRESTRDSDCAVTKNFEDIDYLCSSPMHLPSTCNDAQTQVARTELHTVLARRRKYEMSMVIYDFDFDSSISRPKKRACHDAFLEVSAADGANAKHSIGACQEPETAYPQSSLETLSNALKKSAESQLKLEKWDRKNGLRKHHSLTQWKCCQSRKALQKAKLEADIDRELQRDMSQDDLLGWIEQI